MHIVNDSRIILALDGMSVELGNWMAEVLKPYVIGYKATDRIEDLGARALDGLGSGLRMLDPKLHDTARTVYNRALKYADHADFVTVHGSCSPAALQAAATAAKQGGFKPVAITVLTDITSQQCRSIYGKNRREKVLELARSARYNGFYGIVCASREIKLIRNEWPAAIIIVPGVRSPGAYKHDQRNVDTPQSAIRNGADYIVCGQEVLDAESELGMISVVERINADVRDALAKLSPNSPVRRRTRNPKTKGRK